MAYRVDREAGESANPKLSLAGHGAKAPFGGLRQLSEILIAASSSLASNSCTRSMCAASSKK